MDDVIYLLSTTYVPNKYGVPEPTVTRSQKFCERKNISRSEFYNAGRNGLNPSYVFKIFKGDYSGEIELEYDGLTYAIYRTYEPDDDYIELYVERKGGTNGIETSDP